MSFAPLPEFKPKLIPQPRKGKPALIGPVPDGFEGHEILASPGAPFEQKQIEPVGAFYELLLDRIANVGHEADESENPAEADGGADDADNDEEAKKYAGHKKKKLNRHTEDLYELLGLEHLRWQATQDDIKRAYRQQAKEHHPDKTGGKEDETFKAIHRAFETLSDPKKRQDYDSQDPFDDSIPTAADIKSDADFYKIFGATFTRNAKWSEKKNIPSLGDESTPWDKVSDFYDFWFNFKSWRDFSHDDEYDPEDAESREERRWMERRNAAKRQKKKREESARVIKMVETAYLLDPRVIKQKAEEAARKEKIKQDRRDAIRRAQEEEQRRLDEIKRLEEEEEKRKADEAAAKKRDNQKAKKALQKQRQQLRKLCTESSVDTEDIEAVCTKLGADLNALTELCTALTGLSAEAAREKIKDTLMTAEQKQAAAAAAAAAEAAARAKAAAEAEAAAAKSAEWTPDEITLLGKALIRFPQGTNNRWEMVSQFMDGKRTPKEIIARLKAIKERDLSNKAPETRELEDSFSKWQRTKKDVDVGSDATQRWESEVAAPAAAAPAPAAASPPATQPDSKPAASPKKAATAAPAKATAASAAPAKAATATESSVEDWTADQQKALEGALKKYPSTLSDRWDKIAEDVPGKNKKECIARFKHLVSMVKGAPAKK
eukprot:TRINITY_DN9973_c0_g1_i1.p1 TRINITY_DN9973_c0_g1~~TRINITY_DN9973_c0_g1_i1.p1  ORF type:complete len:670 (+),score=232.91 TRINITY_DN9973_c0_g1_i1:24-2012(+)